MRQALREALRARRPHPRSPPASLCPPLPREHDDEVVKDEVGKDEDEGDVVGTVYLAQEGINAFLAGKEDVLRRALKAIEAVDELKGMEWKESWSTTLPFDKLVIRKKKEIIALGFPLLPTAAVATNSNTPATTSSSEPESGTSKTLRSECGEGTSGSGWRGEHEDYVEPRELARWLEEGREVTLLDTRNDYEWRLGGLRGSLRLPIHSFREFPSALHHLLSSPSSSSSSSSSSSPPSSLPSSSPFSSSSSSGSEAAIHTTAQKREQCVREPDEKQEKAKEKEEERAKEGEVNEGGSSGDALKERTVVIYCTGGVRCEKAAPLLRDKFGFAHVYQLHGGILKYFEEVGARGAPPFLVVG